MVLFVTVATSSARSDIVAVCAEIAVAAFVTVTYLEMKRGAADFDTVRGLAKESLLPAGLLMAALVTGAGRPRTAGFVGKIYIFSAVIDAGYLWLAGVGFVMSMASVYYYLLVIKEMYRDVELGEKEVKSKLVLPLPASAVGVLAVLCTLIVGIWAQPLSILSNIAVYTFMR